MGSLLSVIDQGLIFSIVAMAVFLTSRVIKKDDLTVEGSFGLGGALTAVILQSALPAWLAIVASLVVGGLIGATTGILFARLKMNHLMAGLVTTTACFSISLALASANKIVPEAHTIFKLMGSLPPYLAELLCLGICSATLLVMVRLILRSEIGLLLRSVGENPAFLVHLGKSEATYYLLGFSLANAMTGVAGSLFVQWSGFFSITGNIGTLVTGLASLMIAELFGKKLGLSIMLAGIAYQSIFAATLEIGIDPVWNNLIKASVMVLLIILAKQLNFGVRARHA